MYCITHDGSAFAVVSCDTPDALIVVTRTELQQLSPFYLDIESASQIGGAMLLAMTVAWVIRQVIKALETEKEEP